jgi:hypothetical protein
LPTVKGDTYKVLVHSWTDYASGATDGDYKLSIDSSADPGLTLEHDDIPTSGNWTITADGTVHLPKGP